MISEEDFCGAIVVIENCGRRQVFHLTAYDST